VAVEFNSETVKRAGALYCDYPENILIDPVLNGRHEHTDIESLAADIEANGQNTPVILRKDDQGRPVLVAGHRRWRAVSLLNERSPEQKRKLVGNYFSLTEAEALAMAVSENRFRQDVSPIDDASNIKIFRKRFGLADEDIAKIYFPGAKTEADKATALRFIEQRASLIELAPEAAQAVRDGRMKVTAAVALAKLSKDQQRARVAIPGKVKVADVKPVKKADTSVPFKEFADNAIALAQEILYDHTDNEITGRLSRLILRLAKKAGMEIIPREE